MATAHHTILQGLLSIAAAWWVAPPATAAINPSDSLAAVMDESLQHTAAPVTPAQPIGWLEQPMHDPGAVETSLAAGIATPAALVAGHASHIARQREDLNLSASESAVQRHHLVDQEPLISEHWWQALPGIGVALFLGLALYMRRPIQRKRKYRSTPHEPNGVYRRRGGPR